MTVWNYGISWSKLRAGLDCPLLLKRLIHKEVPSGSRPNYYMEAGKMTQKVFELYFNQGINLKPKGRDPDVLQKVVDKVLTQNMSYIDANVTYPHNLNKEHFLTEVNSQCTNGWNVLAEAGLMDKKVRSERVWNSTFRNLRLYAAIDFETEVPDNGIEIYDGKGNGQETADERQLYHYGLSVMASGKKIKKGGFLYWKHGFRELDFSPAAVKKYVEQHFEPVIPLFQRLKAGTEDLPATPSPNACGQCGWRATCEFSHYKKGPVEVLPPSQVGFGGV